MFYIFVFNETHLNLMYFFFFYFSNDFDLSFKIIKKNLWYFIILLFNKNILFIKNEHGIKWYERIKQVLEFRKKLFIWWC